MCTVSWSPAAGGYQLFFNRDERRSRLTGLPPRPHEENGTKFLAPRDADAGGTWVAVNQFGLTVGLLNLYQAAAAMAKPGRVSRGLLVRALASAPSLEAAARLLDSQDLEEYSPFTLVAAAAPMKVVTYAWDGRNSGEWLPATPPVVSSGHDVVGATASRTSLFAGFGPPDRLGWQDLHAFHRSHLPEKGAYSPCMHRADAKTVSLTAILVEPERVKLAYAPGSPCVTELGSFIELAR